MSSETLIGPPEDFPDFWQFLQKKSWDGPQNTSAIVFQYSQNSWLITIWNIYIRRCITYALYIYTPTQNTQSIYACV
jgi:hypothetical protein